MSNSIDITIRVDRDELVLLLAEKLDYHISDLKKELGSRIMRVALTRDLSKDAEMRDAVAIVFVGDDETNQYCGAP